MPSQNILFKECLNQREKDRTHLLTGLKDKKEDGFVYSKKPRVFFARWLEQCGLLQSETGLSSGELKNLFSLKIVRLPCSSISDSAKQNHFSGLTKHWERNFFQFFGIILSCYKKKNKFHFIEVKKNLKIFPFVKRNCWRLMFNI